MHILNHVDYEWDPEKARLNFNQHGVHLSDAIGALEDERALTIRDDSSGDEERWITMGMDAIARILVVVYTWRGEHLRLISAPRATPRETPVWEGLMKKEYDFSKGKRGSVVPVPKGKTRITIRLDNDLLAWFRREVEQAGGGNYQTLINDALRQYITYAREPLEKTLRRIIREEMRHAS